MDTLISDILNRVYSAVSNGSKSGIIQQSAGLLDWQAEEVLLTCSWPLRKQGNILHCHLARPTCQDMTYDPWPSREHRCSVAYQPAYSLHRQTRCEFGSRTAPIASSVLGFAEVTKCSATCDPLTLPHVCPDAWRLTYDFHRLSYEECLHEVHSSHGNPVALGSLWT